MGENVFVDADGLVYFTASLLSIGGHDEGHFLKTEGGPVPMVGWVMTYMGGNHLWLQPPASGSGTVPGGGTGRATFPAHSVLLGELVAPLNSASPGVAGLVLTSNGVAADPSFQPPVASTDPGLFIHVNLGQTPAAATGTNSLSLGYTTTNNGNLSSVYGYGTTTSGPNAANLSGNINMGGLISNANGTARAQGNTMVGGVLAPLATPVLLTNNANDIFNSNVLLGNVTLSNGSAAQTMGASQNIMAGITAIINNPNAFAAPITADGNIMLGTRQVSLSGNVGTGYQTNVSLIPGTAATPITVLGGLLGTQVREIVEIGFGASALKSQSTALGTLAVATAVGGTIMGHGTLNDAQCTALANQGNLLMVACPFGSIQNVKQPGSNSTDVPAPTTPLPWGMWTSNVKLTGATPLTYNVLNPRYQSGVSVVKVTVKGGDTNVTPIGDNIGVFPTVLGDSTAATGFRITMNATFPDTTNPVTFFYEILFPTS